MRPAGEAEVLARAKARLDRLGLYPEPVNMSGVRIHVVPWLFRVPGFRRFGGYAIARRILLKRAHSTRTWSSTSSATSGRSSTSR